tara:strand:- start:2510 stop:2734 length:225 start_codon:yes stop_codon:yes gene_type:complete
MKPKENRMLKLSDEALGSIMMALQKSLMEQSDIVPILKDFDFKIGEEQQLYIMNPPLVKFTHTEEDYPVFEGSD